MRIQDFYPRKGTFLPGERVSFSLELVLGEKPPPGLELKISIWDDRERIGGATRSLKLDEGTHILLLDWDPPSDLTGGLGAQAEIVHESGRCADERWSAFDILKNWTDFPRYGFVSDFPPEPIHPEEKVDALAGHHVNGLQFYDWQYRHEHLVSHRERYKDPLGRELSLETVRRYIDLAHAHGIAAMPYLAVYAASLPFWEEHQVWALFDESGTPQQFEDFLGLMNPAPDSRWMDHLREECGRIVEETDFDGFHIDQYGEPRSGFDARGNPVDLPGAFQAFIEGLKRDYPDRPVVFNAVKNWPIQPLADSSVDFIYIEVWPPDTGYLDLARIVREARQLSGNKPVVIANYISAAHEANVRLADAVVAASGGTRIEMGEGERLLADPYFPKHEKLSPDLKEALRRYHDFHVCYGDLLGPSVPRAYDREVNAPAGVWTVAGENEGRVWLSLVNLIGGEDWRWNEAHDPPETRTDLTISLPVEGEVRGVFWGSPDQETWRMRRIPWWRKGAQLTFQVPQLVYWGLVVIELEQKGQRA